MADTEAVHLLAQEDSSIAMKDVATVTFVVENFNLSANNTTITSRTWETLQLLTFELPDANLELFGQSFIFTEFSLFRKLPTEARLKIWNFARGRNIIAFIGEDSCLRGRSQSRTPVTFQVNHESRRETRRHYRRPYRLPNYFRSRLIDRPEVLHRVYFDPRVDNVLIANGDKYLWERCFIENFANLKSVEIHSRDWFYITSAPNGDYSDFIYSVFGSMRGLDTLILRGGSNANLSWAGDVKNCVLAFTRCYGRLSRDLMVTGEVVKVPRIRVRMPCHMLQDGIEDCEICRKQPKVDQQREG